MQEESTGRERMLSEPNNVSAIHFPVDHCVLGNPRPSAGCSLANSTCVNVLDLMFQTLPHKVPIGDGVWVSDHAIFYNWTLGLLISRTTMGHVCTAAPVHANG